MKRELTITFEFDDAPWLDGDMQEHTTDAIAYAMDQVNQAAGEVCCDVAFVDAKLDDEILVAGNGFISEEVRKHERQYRAFLKKVASNFPNAEVVQKPLWFVRFGKDGSLKEVKNGTNEFHYYQTAYFTEGLNNPADDFYVSVFADDSDTALKIASEKRTRFLAEREKMLLERIAELEAELAAEKAES